MFVQIILNVIVFVLNTSVPLIGCEIYEKKYPADVSVTSLCLNYHTVLPVRFVWLRSGVSCYCQSRI